MMHLRPVLAAGAALAVLLTAAGCATHHTASDFQPVWEKLVVPVAAFSEDQPAGVAVSSSGRAFVAFPWWDHRPATAVGELMADGSVASYPSVLWNDSRGEGGIDALTSIVCAQALWIDREDHLWILDAGNPRKQGGVVLAGPKLLRIDLSDDSIDQVYYFDHRRDLRDWSFLADVRVDLDRGVAYLADTGRGGIFVYDLRRRTAHSALLDHASTRAEPGVVPRVGGESWTHWLGFVPRAGVAGIELSADGRWLYYHALAGRTLYRVPTAALRDASADVAAGIENLGDTGSAIDGMFLDADGSLYMTAIERDAIIVRRPDGAIEPFVADARLQWPDSLCKGPDGYLYFTTSMHHLHGPYHLLSAREQPYFVMKASIGKVAAAIAARDAARDAHEVMQAAERQADELAQVTKKRHASAQALSEQADQAAAAAQQAQQQAASREEARSRDEAAARLAADDQAAAAARAQDAATAAQLAASNAQAAAQQAQAAAQVAQQRARDAAEQLAAAASAREAADLTAAEMASAQQAYDLAQSRAAAAARGAEEAAQSAANLHAAAVDARAAADAALAEATHQAELAVQAIGRAQSARQWAQSADRLAWEAEHAEHLQDPSATATAQVPTQP